MIRRSVLAISTVVSTFSDRDCSFSLRSRRSLCASRSNSFELEVTCYLREFLRRDPHLIVIRHGFEARQQRLSLGFEDWHTVIRPGEFSYGF